MHHIFFLFLGILFVLIIYAVALYNKFIYQNNLCQEAWSGIDVQLKRRYDLIPNLVNTVKGYAAHESEVLARVTELRNQAMAAQDLIKKNELEGELTSTLKTFFALSESYPELKANQNFIALQNSLMEIEDNLQNARRYYNATVRNFNVLVDSFPSNLLAKKFNFTKKEYFEVENDVERKNVEVKFN